MTLPVFCTDGIHYTTKPAKTHTNCSRCQQLPAISNFTGLPPPRPPSPAPSVVIAVQPVARKPRYLARLVVALAPRYRLAAILTPLMRAFARALLLRPATGRQPSCCRLHRALYAMGCASLTVVISPPSGSFSTSTGCMILPCRWQTRYTSRPSAATSPAARPAQPSPPGSCASSLPSLSICAPPAVRKHSRRHADLLHVRGKRLRAYRRDIREIDVVS